MSVLPSYVGLLTLAEYEQIIYDICYDCLLAGRKNDDSYGSGTGQVFGKHLETVRNSNFNPAHPTKIFLHGWFGAGWNWYIRDMRREILKLVNMPGPQSLCPLA